MNVEITRNLYFRFLKGDEVRQSEINGQPELIQELMGKVIESQRCVGQGCMLIVEQGRIVAGEDVVWSLHRREASATETNDGRLSVLSVLTTDEEIEDFIRVGRKPSPSNRGIVSQTREQLGKIPVFFRSRIPRLLLGNN